MLGGAQLPALRLVVAVSSPSRGTVAFANNQLAGLTPHHRHHCSRHGVRPRCFQHVQIPKPIPQNTKADKQRRAPPDQSLRMWCLISFWNPNALKDACPVSFLSASSHRIMPLSDGSCSPFSLKYSQKSLVISGLETVGFPTKAASSSEILSGLVKGFLLVCSAVRPSPLAFLAGLPPLAGAALGRLALGLALAAAEAPEERDTASGWAVQGKARRGGGGEEECHGGCASATRKSG